MKLKRYNDFNESIGGSIKKFLGFKDKEEDKPLPEYKPREKRKGCYCKDCGIDCNSSDNNCPECDSTNIIDNNSNVPRLMKSSIQKDVERDLELASTGFISDKCFLNTRKRCKVSLSNNKSSLRVEEEDK